MAKAKCPICKKIKENVGPKIVGSDKIQDRRFKRPIDTLITKVMCEEYWQKKRT